MDFKRVLRSLVKPISELYKERRRRLRLPLSCDVSLSGPFGLLHATAVDVSRHGMAVHAGAPLEPGEIVVIRIPEPGLVGFAYVRRCSPSGKEYIIGLEFRERLAREHDEASTWERKRYKADGSNSWEGWDD